MLQMQAREQSSWFNDEKEEESVRPQFVVDVDWIYQIDSPLFVERPHLSVSIASLPKEERYKRSNIYPASP